ncbi:hypothetical protein KSC_096630 [Ktedonobacter sp. SOSP1-52]|nr:class I adenylate-forming enzyme family protein [Ktedonobacter sp. SOSP1-52]GHO70771.1 hypothetical protein KSC_096630 [Ktedonobacter sp. SOSP1-52]
MPTSSACKRRPISNRRPFAQALIAAGLQAGERVALFLENSPAFVVSYLGTHLAGGIVVLVNTQYRQVELSHIMNDAGVRFCMTSSLRAPKRRTMVAVGPFVVDLKYSQHAKLHSGWFTVPGPTSKGLETPSYAR